MEKLWRKVKQDHKIKEEFKEKEVSYITSNVAFDGLGSKNVSVIKSNG